MVSKGTTLYPRAGAALCRSWSAKGFAAGAIATALFGATALTGCSGKLDASDPNANNNSSGGAGVVGQQPGTAGSGVVDVVPSGGGTAASTGGASGGTPADVLASATCTTPNPGTAPLRRLSNAEYRNSVGDVLGDSALATQATTGFLAENESLGFRNSANLLVVSSLVAQQYMDAAETIANQVSQLPEYSTCATAADPRACVQDFINSFGQRVYRRPLTDVEVQRYLSQYDQAITFGDATTAVQWIVFTMLQSPNFLYRVEVGQPVAAAPGVMQPTPYEMAARLSYLLWQSTPDDALLMTAQSGGLTSKDQVLTQARQMMQDAKADRLYEFFDQWLDVDTAQAMQRDTTVFPNLEADLPALFREETRNFVLNLLHSPTGNLNELFTAPYTYANARLAAHYGLSGPTVAGLTGEAFTRVDRPDGVGFFSQGGFISAHDKPTRSSIVRRGLKLRTDLLCQLIPAPPNNVQINLDALSADLTQRERLAMHRTNPSCAGCHELMDPVGLVFEGYDAVGRPRTVDEKGNPIDASSTISRTQDLDGPVTGPADFATKMAGSEEVRSCYTTQTFRFFYGRDAAAADSCTQAELAQAFAGSNYSLSELIVALTQTDAFLYRPMNVPNPN